MTDTELAQIQNDADLIRRLGGATKVATLLGYTQPGGVQRVQNWLTRGIPSRVKLDNAGIFLTVQSVVGTEPRTAVGQEG